MFHKRDTYVVLHSVNGNEEDAGAAQFVEVDGQKFVPDEADATKPKLNDKGEKIPFVEKKKDEGGAGDDEKSLDELAKSNPHVARMLEEKKKLEDDAKKKAEDDKKKADDEAAKKGEWQKLAEDRGVELTKAKEELEKKDTILGKYVGSVKEILTNVMKDIPEENRGLIPDNFSPREKLEYITKNAKLLGLKGTIMGKGGKVEKNDTDPNATDEEKIEAELEELKKKEVKTQSDHTKIWELAKKLKEARAKKQEK